MGNKQATLADTVMDIRLASKQLEAASRRAEKDEKKERGKVAKAISKGNKEGAQIYAQNAIRKKHEALNYLKLASKMDAVASRLDTAEKSQQMSQNISRTIPQLNKALTDMTPEKMAQNMEKFEKIFEDLDVRTEYMANAIDSTTATATPVGQFDELIQQVGEEHALNVEQFLRDTPLQNPLQANANATAAAQANQPAAVAEEDDSLEKRLAQLRS